MVFLPINHFLAMMIRSSQMINSNPFYADLAQGVEVSPVIGDHTIRQPEPIPGD
jgi:hypothetical protein